MPKKISEKKTYFHKNTNQKICFDETCLHFLKSANQLSFPVLSLNLIQCPPSLQKTKANAGFVLSNAVHPSEDVIPPSRCWANIYISSQPQKRTSVAAVKVCTHMNSPTQPWNLCCLTDKVALDTPTTGEYERGLWPSKIIEMKSFESVVADPSIYLYIRAQCLHYYNRLNHWRHKSNWTPVIINNQERLQARTKKGPGSVRILLTKPIQHCSSTSENKKALGPHTDTDCRVHTQIRKAMQTVSGIGYTQLSTRRPSSLMTRLWRAGHRDTWAAGWRSAMRNVDTRTAVKVPDGLGLWSQITAESDRDFLWRASALTPVETNKYRLYGYNLQISWSALETGQCTGRNKGRLLTADFQKYKKIKPSIIWNFLSIRAYVNIRQLVALNRNQATKSSRSICVFPDI